MGLYIFINRTATLSIQNLLMSTRCYISTDWGNYLIPVLVLAALFMMPKQAGAFISADSLQKEVFVSRVEGSIGPTVANYIRRSIQKAEEAGAEALVIEMDTPGGLLNATKDIVQDMLAARIPVVVYVSPEGASAGSAGVFITLASHFAAMAPATNIGAASPISMGGGQMDTVQQKKIFNYAESWIESIARERERNVEWAKAAVRDAESITADEALEINVIDIIAADQQDLLNQLEGRAVEEDTLYTSQAKITEIPLDFGERFLRFLFQPQVILILTLISIYGIIGEISNPGAFIPGIAGVIALILLLYSVAALPINTAGFILIALAIVLFVLEAFTPTFGIFITGGGIAFFIGSMMLFRDLPPSLQLSWYWLVPATLLTMLFFIIVATMGLKAQLGPVKSGQETLVGEKAEVVDPIDQHNGRVFVDGSFWKAISEEPIEEGQQCEIIRTEGLTLHVKPVSKKT